MVLVYCERNSSRLQYAFDLVLNTMLGLEYRLVHDPEVFKLSDAPRICYGRQPISDKEVFVEACGLLHEKGLNPVDPVIAEVKGLKVLFPSKGRHCQAGYDIFSAAFYLVSRYEEYLPHLKDRFGRYEPSQSLAFRHGFLQQPVVDHYALHVKSLLKNRFKSLVFPERRFRHIPTIDVDVAYAFKGRGFFRTLYGLGKSLLRGDMALIRERFMVLTGKQKDPFDTYDEQLALHRRYGLKAWYFFLCGDYGDLDRNIAFHSPAFQKLVLKVADYAYVGIHPSAASNSRPSRLSEEVRRLSTLIKSPVTHSRQHYLMLSMPDTYQALIARDIMHDFSMGFAAQPGFRASTCTPFLFYDLSREAVTALQVIPLSVMDGTLRDYLKLSPTEALGNISRLIGEVKLVNGTFVSLWHNDAVSETGAWSGWKYVYEAMLKMTTEQTNMS